jgi:hypothetical protein
MNLADPSFKYFAHVGIKPVGTLLNTADALGEVLSVSFLEDSIRRYDEFPAFVAETENVRYALLGIPDPGEDLRDNPTDDFELIVESINPSPFSQKRDVSGELIALIKESGKLVCWSLN